MPITSQSVIGMIKLILTYTQTKQGENTTMTLEELADKLGANPSYRAGDGSIMHYDALNGARYNLYPNRVKIYYQRNGQGYVNVTISIENATIDAMEVYSYDEVSEISTNIYLNDWDEYLPTINFNQKDVDKLIQLIRQLGISTDNSVLWHFATKCKPNGIIVSRHKAAIEFINKELPESVDYPVYAEVTPTLVRGQHVYGNIPLHLAAEAEKVTAIEFGNNPPRGSEYTLEDMYAAKAALRTYMVKEIK